MTEFEFTLPHGLIGEDNNLYRQGRMRLARAKDELAVQNDSRFKQNPAYGVLLYLSSTIVSLEGFSQITPQILENLSILDLAYLREFYNRINQHQQAHIAVQCPHCQQNLEVELVLAEKRSATLLPSSMKR